LKYSCKATIILRTEKIVEAHSIGEARKKGIEELEKQFNRLGVVQKITIDRTHEEKLMK